MDAWTKFIEDVAGSPEAAKEIQRSLGAACSMLPGLGGTLPQPAENAGADGAKLGE